MKVFIIFGLISYLCITNALSTISEEKQEVKAEVNEPEDVTTMSTISETEDSQLQETVSQQKPLTGVAGEEIIISKDNVIPFLKTVVLAFTHKKDPTYKEVLQSGTKTLFKLAEKKIGGDKHMKGLLNILKKFVENYKPENLEDKEEEFLGDLAEAYLRKHKFQLLFPESLLLHQPEMKEFVEKKRQLGDLNGRQLKLDFEPYLSRISDLTTRVRSTIQELPIFNNLNLDRIGSTFSSIGTVFNEYVPALRYGGADFGISVGSLSALAAVGALVSAPFFLKSFNDNSKEEENDLFYPNRRTNSFGYTGEQFVLPPQGGHSGGIVLRPQWMEESGNDQQERNTIQRVDYSNQQVQTYKPRVNPQYSEPTSFAANQQPQNVQESNTYTDDEAYNKYLNEYNEWLQKYHSAANHQESPSKEYQEYYEKYKDWYAKYYKEQFGEALPSSQSEAPNAYEENNRISNEPALLPPQVNAVPRIDATENSGNVFVPSQNQWLQPRSPEIVSYDEPDQNIPVDSAYEESSNFQVFHVEPPKLEDKPRQREPEVNHLPQPSALVGNLVPRPVVNQLTKKNTNTDQHNVNTQETNLNPVYRPTPAPNDFNHGHPTESGFRPLGSQPHTVLLFKKKAEEQKNSFNRHYLHHTQPEEKEVVNNIPKLKTVSIFKPSVSVIEAKLDNDERRPAIHFMTETSPVAPNYNEPKADIEDTPTTAATTMKSRVTGVTSRIFHTTAKPTPEAATTPPPYFKKRINQSVRVVTSTSVVTSKPVVQNSKPTKKDEFPKNEIKKRKVTLTELLQKQKTQLSSLPPKVQHPKFQEQPKAEERRIELSPDDFEDREEPKKFESESPNDLVEDDVPVYALDPFYGPRLSRTDAIFHQLSLTDENCREQVVCNMYKNPNAYTPLSDFLSRQLTVTYDQLKRPAINDGRVLRFFKYLQAARAGQDGFDCVEKFPKCSTDTTRLSYKPIVNAYKKVSVLMNASGST